MLRLNDPGQLWRRYALALSLVLTLLGASHYASLKGLSNGEEASSVINLAGRQRMLSQRILYLSALTMETRSEEADPRLASAVDSFWRAHMALTRGGDLGLSWTGAEKRASIYDTVVDGRTLDSMSFAFAAYARKVIAGDDEEREAAWRRMQAVGPTELLDRLDDATKRFETDARDGTRRVRDIADVTFALAILVVVFEAIFIFWPAQRMVSSTILRMRRANARLANANRESEAARDAAERAMRVRTQFLANMSHELRTPLNGVMGMLDLLKDVPEAEARERARTAHASASHLLELMDDILDLSRLESGQLALESAPFDPLELAEGATRVVAEQAAAKKLDLRVERPSGALGAEPRPMVLGDPTRTRQLLINLVGNAMKFTEEGEVVVTVSHAAGRLRYEVRDTGIGIPPEAQPRLFERFVQADASTTRRFGGSGLGLAICRQIVDAMGGEIGLRSVEGRGSVFHVEISAPIAEAAPSVPVRDAPSSLRVLVAEDNGVNRKVASAFLRRLGHEAVCVSDGAQAVEALRGPGSFDLVLMDVQMPVMDGIEAARAIRGLGPRGALPILALTANALAEQRDEIEDAGMDGHLSKPIKAEALSEAIADAIWTARARAGATREVRRASA